MEETTHYTGDDFDSLVDLTVRMGKICAELEDGGNKSVDLNHQEGDMSID